MKTRFILTLCMLSLCGFAQVNNPKFSGLKGWYTADVKGASYAIDSATNGESRNALKMVAGNLGAIPTFSQKINYHTGQLKIITLSASVKTVDVARGISLWCQVWDGQQQIGFSNSNMQSSALKGTNDWRKMSVTVLLPEDTKTLVIGGYLIGTGTAWFTDVAVTEKPRMAASASLMAYSNEVHDLIKNHALYKDSIDWNQVDQELDDLSSKLDGSDYDLINQYFTWVLRKSGDIHSFFQSKMQATSYASGNTVALKPQSELLQHQIAYLKIPAFGSINQQVMNQFADTVQQLIKNLDEQKPIGWIVDLRGNGGGNMYPMIAGLGPLIGTGKLGYFIGKKKNPWTYDKNGSAGMAKATNPYRVLTPDPKISVLIDDRTGSSGEMTAISFIGKPNVKLFGQPSAGYITANQYIKLSNGGTLQLATTYVTDRNLKKYATKIIPDVTVEKVDGEDAVLNKAADWLTKK